MDEDLKWLLKTAGLILIGLVLGVILGVKATIAVYHPELVKRGHAYWHVNEDGTTEFKWKEETK